MLPTAAIVLDVVEPTLGDWPQDTVWLQMSSVGAAEADQLSRVAETHGVRLVDAPVSGSTHPAEGGQLTILASGPHPRRAPARPASTRCPRACSGVGGGGSAAHPGAGTHSARAAVAPVFDALSSRVLWVGEAGMGSRLKLAANHWMIAMVAALAESMHLCQAMDLDEQQFIALLQDGPLGSAYAMQKLDEMRLREYPAGFPIRLALKDLELVREVEESAGAPMPLLDTVLDRFSTASHDHADEDLAAIYELGGPAKA